MKKIILKIMIVIQGAALASTGNCTRVVDVRLLNCILDFPKDDYKLHRVAGYSFFLDDIDDCIKNVLKQNIPWEKETAAVLKKYTPAGTTALDIGAHIGTHTITLSKAVGPLGKVICFEPQPKIFRELCMNLVSNKCDNVVVYNYAVGDVQKTCYLGDPIPNNEGARYLDANGGEEVYQITVDSLNLSNVSFIKIDVENREEFALAGCRETILRNKPVILVEIRGNKVKAAMDSENIPTVKNKILRQIESYGYQTLFFSCDDYLAIPL